MTFLRSAVLAILAILLVYNSVEIDGPILREEEGL